MADTLPTHKTDARAKPTGALATQFMAASDYNAILDTLQGVAGGTPIHKNALLDTVSADNGDNSVVLVWGTDEGIQTFSTAITGAKTVTLPATATNGDTFRINRTGAGSGTLTIQTSAAVAVFTIAPFISASVEVVWNGTTWVLARW